MIRFLRHHSNTTLPESLVLINISAPTCPVIAKFTLMILYLQMDALDVLVEGTGAKALVGTNMAREITNLEMNAAYVA